MSTNTLPHNRSRWLHSDTRTMTELLAGITDETVLEAVIEELETLAAAPNQLTLALEKHFG